MFSNVIEHASILRLEQDKDALASPIQHCSRAPEYCDKEKTRQNSLFTDDLVVHKENPKKSIKNLTRTDK